MRHEQPTDPARPAPEPNRIDNVSPSGDGRSSYWGLMRRRPLPRMSSGCARSRRSPSR